jgi:hypothetical protein
MRYLSSDPLYLSPREVIDPATLGLVTTGTLVEWTSERNVVLNTGAARGSRLIWTPASGSLATKEIRDDNNAAGSNADPPTWVAQPTTRNRKLVGQNDVNLFSLTSTSEVPITTGQFTIMLVTFGYLDFTMGYDPAGANVPFGLRIVSPSATGAVRVEIAPNAANVLTMKFNNVNRPHVMVVSAIQSGAALAAFDTRYQPQRWTLGSNFAASANGDVTNGPKAIRLNPNAFTVGYGYIRIANVAYTEAQCIAWRDFLMQYWLGSVVQP